MRKINCSILLAILFLSAVSGIKAQTPMQAIQAATINGADLLGWEDKIASIKFGKYADIVAVTANPLQNISVLENMQFVMKDGVVYKSLLTK